MVGGGLEEQSSSPYIYQEAERGKEISALHAFYSTPTLIPSGFPAYGMVPPTFREGLFPLVNFVWKCSNRHIHGVLH
jgi:hypothetical protein